MIDNEKEFLNQYKYAVMALECLESQYREAERLATSGGCVEIATIDGERHIIPRRGVKSNTSRDRLIINMVAIMDRIESQRESALITLNSVKKAIDGVEDSELMQLLTLRYIERKTWEEIAGEMNYSLRHIQEIHTAKALPAVRKYLIKSHTINNI